MTTLPEIPDYYDFRGAANTRPLTAADKALISDLLLREENAIKNQEPITTKEGRTDLSGVSKLVHNLIETYNLPVLFTDLALQAVGMFARNTDEAIILLMDCLTTFERETVTVNKLSRLYVFGFYNEELIKKIIVGTVHTKRHPWYFVYPM